jgi:hypothetical protein
LLIGGKQYALCVYFEALLFNVIAKNPFWLTVTIPIGNTLAALFSAWLLTRNNKQIANLYSVGDYLRLAILAGTIGSGIAVLPGTTIFLVSGAISTNTYLLNLSHWWMGDALGISLFPQHGDNPEMLMNHADTAPYKARDKGRGGFAYFSEDLTIAVRERIELETRLRRAIKQQDLRVFYQPQVDITSGRTLPPKL